MPYNPGVSDISGQLLAQGIQQGMAGLTNGITEFMRKKEEKDKQEQAFALLRSASDAQIPDDALRAGIKGLGGAGAFQVAQHVSQQKRQQELDKQSAALNQAHLAGMNAGTQQTLAQINQMAAVAAQQQRNENALSTAFNPTAGTADAIQGGADFSSLPSAPATDPMSVVMRAGKGGADAATLAHLASMSENLAQSQQRLTPKPAWSPSVVDLGGGQRAITTSPQSAVPIHDPKTGLPLTDVAKLMADRDAAKTPEDRAKLEQAIEATRSGSADRPLTVNEFMMSPSLSAKYKDDYGTYREEYASQLAKIQKRAAVVPNDAARVRVKLSDLK